MSEEGTEEEIKIQGLPGWFAMKKQVYGGFIYYFYKDWGKTFVGSFDDKGNLFIPNKIDILDDIYEQKPKLIGNPIQAGRYIYLMTQKHSDSNPKDEFRDKNPLKENDFAKNLNIITYNKKLLNGGIPLKPQIDDVVVFPEIDNWEAEW